MRNLGSDQISYLFFKREYLVNILIMPELKLHARILSNGKS